MLSPPETEGRSISLVLAAPPSKDWELCFEGREAGATVPSPPAGEGGSKVSVPVKRSFILSAAPPNTRRSPTAPTPRATGLNVGFCACLHRKSLDLVESLLRLSEVGQYEQVKQLFGFPIKHCPDMLVLALLQISTSWHTLRHELISTLMPIFLGNHPNSAIILHYAWHGQVSPAPPHLRLTHSNVAVQPSFQLDAERSHGNAVGRCCLYLDCCLNVPVLDDVVELFRASLPPSASLLCIRWQSGT